MDRPFNEELKKFKALLDTGCDPYKEHSRFHSLHKSIRDKSMEAFKMGQLARKRDKPYEAIDWMEKHRRYEVTLKYVHNLLWYYILDKEPISPDEETDETPCG